MKRANKAVLATTLLLMLTGCGTTGFRPTISFHKPVPINPPRVAPMTLGEVQWKAYDKTTLKNLVAEMEAHPDRVVYVLTQDGFTALALNLAEMKRYITDQKDANEFLVKSIGINAATKPETKPSK